MSDEIIRTLDEVEKLVARIRAQVTLQQRTIEELHARAMKAELDATTLREELKTARAQLSQRWVLQ